MSPDLRNKGIPMSTDYTTRFQTAVKKRDTLRGKMDRVQGKLEGAQARKAEIEQRLRDKKIDPSQIDQFIKRVEGRLKERVEEIERKVSEVEDLLVPYLEDIT